jgi:hypothetical protein
MRKARFAEKDKVIDIISSTFETNPGVNWIINKRGNHKKKIHRLASYAFLKSFLREGAFISSNENGNQRGYFPVTVCTFIDQSLADP